MSFLVKKVSGPVALDGDFENDPQWRTANTIFVANRMYPKYNIFQKAWRKLTGVQDPPDDFAPETELKLLHDGKKIYGLFRVRDHYVRATASRFGEQACLDSCVEFFLRPANNLRYYNFEFTAGGYLLLYNITHLRKKKYTVIPREDIETIERSHSLPAVIDPEITVPTTWYLGFAAPVSFFVKYGDGVSPELSGQTWTANVFKCGDATSHPHWLTWQPLPKLDFHQPECFAPITFE